MTVKDVLLGIQTLLDEPCLDNPANAEAYMVFTQSKDAYEEVVRRGADLNRI